MRKILLLFFKICVSDNISADTLDYCKCRVYAPDAPIFMPGIQSGVNRNWREFGALSIAFSLPTCLKGSTDCNTFVFCLQPSSGKLHKQTQSLGPLCDHHRQFCEGTGGHGSSVKPLFTQHPTHTGSNSSLVHTFINISTYSILQQIFF